MDKCVKCGRCVEACQEIQTVRAINSSRRSFNYRISTAFNQPYADSPCVFCGHCETVCPVGAIYEQDQSASAWAAINDGGRGTAVQISKMSCAELGKALGLPAETLSPGKTVTALKRLGFDKAYDAQFTLDLAASELCLELNNRVKTGDKKNLPLISACSQSAVKFIENFYPDLASRLSPCRDMRKIFQSLVKEEKTTVISIEPCISSKSIRKSADEPDITLTVKELARMLRLAGIDFSSLPESPFDSIKTEIDLIDMKKQALDIRAKCLVVNGLGEARKILDSVRKGECNADFIEIKSCPSEGGHARCASISSKDL
jgi:iron only hydrogenase large subunit-like protein